MQRSTPTVRRLAVTLGVALLLAAGWWVVRAPTMARRPVVAPPEIDIDPPALRARRQAAAALATTPDDPWTFAESLAPSAPAPASAAKAEDCGIGGRPSFEPDPAAQRPIQTAGASQRYVAAQARVDAALRSSADPLERAVADLINVGNMRSEAGRDEAVVEQAVATSDVRLYALAYGICHSSRQPAPGCGSISLDRWTQLDADNGVPWLMKLGEAQALGDAAGARVAIAGIAGASRFDTYLQAPAGVVANIGAKDDRDLAAVNDLAFNAMAETAVLPFPPYQALTQVCRSAPGDAQLVQTCRTISDMMFAHSDSLFAQSISGALLFLATGDSSRRDYIRAERALAAAHWSPATGFSQCRDMRDALKKLVRVGQVGAVEALREGARQFVAP